MRKGRILFCIFLITVTAYAIFASIGWSFKAKLFPLSISIPLLMLATVQLLLILFGKEETNEGGAMDVEFSTDVAPEIVRRRVLGIFSWIIAFIALVYLLRFSNHGSAIYFSISQVSKRGDLALDDPRHGHHMGLLPLAVSIFSAHPVRNRRDSDLARAVMPTPVHDCQPGTWRRSLAAQFVNMVSITVAT